MKRFILLSILIIAMLASFGLGMSHVIGVGNGEFFNLEKVPKSSISMDNAAQIVENLHEQARHRNTSNRPVRGIYDFWGIDVERKLPKVEIRLDGQKILPRRTTNKIYIKDIIDFSILTIAHPIELAKNENIPMYSYRAMPKSSMKVMVESTCVNDKTNLVVYRRIKADRDFQYQLINEMKLIQGKKMNETIELNIALPDKDGEYWCGLKDVIKSEGNQLYITMNYCFLVNVEG